jgi:hypothetical protein
MRRRFLVYALMVAHAVTFASQPDIAALGPQVGAEIPRFAALDQFGRRQTLESIVGAQGAMVVFYRSADW